jgi:KaiC/GvpD/RAD55 family RecA-like ATPase
MLHDYIEFIDGGYPAKGESRKNIIMVKDMKVKKGIETYRSLWNYNEDYPDYVDKNESITGYSGKHNSDILFFDFDIDKDKTGTFEDVQQEVINLVEMLVHSYEVPSDLIRITFSGGKGFHIILPFQVVQLDPEMSSEFCDRYRELIKIIVKDFKYADTTIYNINRVIRVVNTQHGKSKLYKIPVTLAELKNKNFNVKETAKHRRNADWKEINFEEIVPNSELNDIWRDIKIVKQSHNKMDGTKTNTFIEAFSNTNPEGRHQALAKIAGNLIDKSIDFNNCLAIVTAWNNGLDKPMTSERLDKDLRGLYKSFWNKRPEVNYIQTGEIANPSSTTTSAKGTMIATTSLKDILVYGYKYNEQYQNHITELSRGGRIKTGYDVIDEPIRGMIAGEVTIIVGKTSVGKSAFVHNILLNNVHTGRTVLFFSLEMPLPTVAERTLQMELEKSGRHIEQQFTQGDMWVQEQAEQAFRELDDFITIPIQGIKYEVMENYIFETEKILNKKIDIVAIDYAGLMKTGQGSLYEQQSEISRDLKALAGRTHTAVISLAQVSKQYTDTTPIDLDATRDSGVITEAGDYVIGLWRASGYDEKSVLLKGNVCKNRNGAKVNFDAKFSRSSLLFDISAYIPEGDDDDLPF